MKPESPIASAAADQLSLLSSDLEPMYELSEADYVAVINRLAGLLVNTIQRHRDDGQTDRAMALASQAHDVLLNYDDDVADLIRSAARTEGNEEGLGQAREEALW